VGILETELGVPLPESYRDTLLTVSSHVEFRWFVPRDTRLPRPLHGIFSGGLRWSIALTKACEEARRSWVSEVFNNRADAYDLVWWDKLAFYEVGNGDYLAFDLCPETQGRIVYLSHDDGEGHGYVLAEDFQSLLRRWIPLACVGGEDWQWLPFHDSATGSLDPAGGNARLFRKLLGIPEALTAPMG